jgi:two-component system sensor histidine kinase CiaH
MIKKLQRKFIIIATLSVSFVMLVIIGGINIANFVSTNAQTDMLLSLLADNDGRFPAYNDDDDDRERDGYDDTHELAGLSEESRFMTRYFLARVDGTGRIFQLDTGHIAALSSKGAQKLALKVLESGRETGYSGVYKFLVSKQPYGKLIVFLDCRDRLSAMWRLLGASLLIGAGGLVVVFALVSYFSRYAVKPVAESIDKQRRFVTDASHELKTPLAIISANVEVLGYTSGKSEWLDSIQNQTKRLSGLIDDLLLLSKLDEESAAAPVSVFSLSAAADEVAEPYKAVALTHELTFDLVIRPGIGCRGDETGIRRLISVLLDNAFKYTGRGGHVAVSLTRRGRWAEFEVFNTADNPDRLGDVPLDRLFDRFYRSDTSRSRETGGYGLGLSIAKSIAESNRGAITVKRRGSGIVFTATLPHASQNKSANK